MPIKSRASPAKGKRAANSSRGMAGETPTRWLFLAIYLVVDLGYVLLSKSFYEATVIAIQGKGLPDGRVPDALVAYALLAVGWFCVAAPSVRGWVERGYRAPAAGAIAGVVYGLAVYGVYNFTLRAQFENYGLGIALRDVAWGCTSNAAVLAAYAHRAFGSQLAGGGEYVGLG